MATATKYGSIIELETLRMGENRMSESEKTGRLSKADERALIARARKGDRTAVRTLIEGHKDRLYAFVWRMVRNHHDAEEVCQDAFLKAFSSLDSFSTEYRFSTWLFTIGYRLCLNGLRKKRVATTDFEVAQYEATDDDGQEVKAQTEEARLLKETVWDAVENLTPPQRAAVLLFYRQELGCQEIADILELPVATVKSHLHRARARLRDLLEPVMMNDNSRLRILADLAG